MTIQGSVLNGVQQVFTFPMDKTGFLNEKTTPEMLENASIFESIGTRALFVLQIVASIVALPIILLLGIIDSFVYLCKGEGAKGLKEMTNSFTQHLLVALPISLLGIFAPLKTTHAALQTQMERLDKYSFDLSDQAEPVESSDAVTRAAFNIALDTAEPGAPAPKSPVPEAHSTGVLQG